MSIRFRRERERRRKENSNIKLVPICDSCRIYNVLLMTTPQLRTLCQTCYIYENTRQKNIMLRQEFPEIYNKNNSQNIL